MVDSGTVKIGFISPRSASSPHFDTFRALFPPGVEMDFAGLELAPGSLYELEGSSTSCSKGSPSSPSSTLGTAS